MITPRFYDYPEWLKNMVFECVLELEVDELSYADHDFTTRQALQALKLSQICQTLRTLAYSTPRLWVYLPENMPLEQIRDFASRSGACGLEIRFNVPVVIPNSTPSRKLQDFISFICSCRHRWESLHTTVAAFTEYLLPRLDNTNFPKLEKLAINRPFFVADVVTPAHLQFDCGGLTTPRLRAFSGLDATPFGIAPSALTSLQLKIDLRQWHAEEMAALVELVVPILQAAGTLENLVLHFSTSRRDMAVGDIDANAIPRMAFPGVRKLGIGFDGESPCLAILENIETPSVKKVEITIHRSLYFHNMLSCIQNPANVTDVEIVWTLTGDKGNVHWLALFKHFPSLRGLTVSKGSLYACQFLVGLESEEEKASISPDLICLTLNRIATDYGSMAILLETFRKSPVWTRLEEINFVQCEMGSKDLNAETELISVGEGKVSIS